MIKRMDDVIEEAYMEGRFKVKVGNKVVAKGRNKWTRYFASAIVENVITYSKYESWSNACGSIGYYADSRVGRDTSTPTDPSMTDLVDKVDIAPSSITRQAIRSFYGEYKAEFTFIWDTGVLPNMTIGELGVYGVGSSDDWSSPWENPNISTVVDGVCFRIYNASKRLIARISSGDGDFDPINYDNTKVLKLEWYFIITT